MNQDAPVSFPDWAVRLEADVGLEAGVKTGFRSRIIAYLAHLKRTGHVLE